MIISPHGTAANETFSLTNTSGTDNGAIALTATAGGISATVADEKDLTLGNAVLDAYFKVAASSTAGSEDVRIVNTNGTDEAAIAITSSAGGVDVDAAAAKDVNIAGGQVALVSKDNAASAISLTANQGSSETIVVTNTQGTGAAAIELTSTAGGVTISTASSSATSVSGNLTGTSTNASSNTGAISGFDAALNDQTGTTYTLVAGDNGKVVTLNNANAITVTIGTGLGNGFNCLLVQKGAGQVTISASGTTVVNRSSETKTAGQYATVSVINIGSEQYILSGDTGS
jgi:hypothetical protein